MITRGVCSTVYCVLVLGTVCVVCRSLQKEYTNGENETTNEKNVTKGPACVTSEGINLGPNDVIFSSPGQCIGVECGSNGEVVYLRCRPAKVRRGCHGRYFDLTKPFPECCPAAVC